MWWLFFGEMRHGLRTVVVSVETEHGDVEAVFPQRLPGLVDDLGEMACGHGTDLVAAGIDQAQHQWLATHVV